MKIDDNKISNFLPIGYLYLVAVGIIKESLIYGQIGINILSYSSITDILLSPIVNLTSNLIFLPLILIIAFFLYYVGVVFAFKNREKKWVRKYIVKMKQGFWERTEKEIKTGLFHKYLITLTLGIFCVYIGFGLAKGRDIAQEINKNKMEYNHSLSFISSDKTEKIFLIGANSAYYFYVEKGNDNIKISPITAIKTLEIVNEEKDREREK